MSNPAPIGTPGAAVSLVPMAAHASDMDAEATRRIATRRNHVPDGMPTCCVSPTPLGLDEGTARIPHTDAPMRQYAIPSAVGNEVSSRAVQTNWTNSAGMITLGRTARIAAAHAVPATSATKMLTVPPTSIKATHPAG